MTDLSQLPSIDQFLLMPAIKQLVAEFGRPLTIQAARHVLDEIRQSVRDQGTLMPDPESLQLQVKQQLNAWTEPSLLSVINASGVILHTNLGRAPLSRSVRQAIAAAGTGYSNLEFDLATGRRGSRTVHANHLLRLLTGAEAGLVVNNNAGAVLLVLSALARDQKVIVSRTQLIEIGGGFRIPDVMQQSGAHLLEIGTTNRLHIADFETALRSHDVALVLIAHPSNFKMIGFHTEPELTEIVSLAHQHGVGVVHDLGSGAFLDTANYGLAHEPTIQESLSAGCDLVCFSGDKLLGGPQAGIIIGSEKYLAPLRKHPLARALRAGKLTLAGVSANLYHYLRDEAETEIPIWQMLARPQDQLRTTADNWQQYLGKGEVIEGRSTVGGGSLPTEEMPTWLLALDIKKPDAFLAALRKMHPPIVARIENNLVLLDPRTVLPEQEAVFLRNLTVVLENE